MLDSVEQLICPECDGSLLTQVDQGLSCQSCGRIYVVKDGVIDLLLDPALRTMLEDIDYDAVANYTEKALAGIAKSWMTVFAKCGVDPQGATILEIGSGTGALTAGLLQHSGASRLFATDISQEFLRKTISRSGADGRMTAIRCDCNRIPVRDGSCDLVVGRSILHHLLNYEDVLAQCVRILKPGGKAIFFEPVLEGKLVVGLFSSLVASLAELGGTSDFTKQELNKLRSQARHVTKEAWYPQDPESLSKIEDKFIFSIPRMRASAVRAGFASADYCDDDRPVDPSMWSYFIHAMRGHGIDPAKFAPYRFIGESYEKTFGLFSAHLFAPMGYFCFSKEAAAQP